MTQNRKQYTTKTKLNIKNSKRHTDDIETPDRDDTRRHRKGQMDRERKIRKKLSDETE